MRNRSRRAALALPAFAVVALTATSCATANPGDAAVVGGTSIAQATIGEQLRSVNETVGVAPDTPSADGATALVYGNIVVTLIEQTAQRHGVSVPEAQVDGYYQQEVQSAGGEEQLRQTLAQQGIAPQLIRGFVRSTLLQQAVANKIAPGADPQAQGEALRAAVTEYAEEVGVAVAPKYGVWDSEALELVDRTDPVAKPADVGVGVPTPAPTP